MKYLPGMPVSGLRFEPSASRILSRSATHSPAMFDAPVTITGAALHIHSLNSTETSKRN
jgi:hypothetical protein